MKYKLISPILLLVTLSCTNYSGNVSIPRIQEVAFTSQPQIIIVDTLRIDASATSLRGEWDIRDDKLFFTDYSLTGIREYSSEGQFIEAHIKKGRGPGESPFPFNTVCFGEDRRLYTLDQSWFYSVYDSTLTETVDKYRFLSETNYKKGDWNRLLLHPDPEVDNMYEFNLDVRDMKPMDVGQVLVPVYTEHAVFNAYSSVNHRSFWKNAYLFMIVDPGIGEVVSKFGHFPAIYQKRRIPAFYRYGFDVGKDGIYVSFAADSLIYIYDRTSLTPKSSFGRSFLGFNDNYPENKSFDDYSSSWLDLQKEYGWFGRVLSDGRWFFRSYKLAADAGYGIQVYKDYTLVSDLHFNEEPSIIGKIGLYYYVSVPVDTTNDQFVFYRFKICD